MRAKMMRRFKRVLSSLRKERKIPIVRTAPDVELLAGKGALITGGTGGIGGAIAERMIACGAQVVITGTTEERVRARADSIGCYWVVMDVANVKSIQSAVDRAASMLPGGRIDILVNAAGVIGHARFPNVGEDEWDAVVAANAKGTFFVSQEVARLMMQRDVRGHILNVSSSSALRPASSAYNVSKWAVRGMTLGMADELVSHGITVNAIGPGPTATTMLGKDGGASIEHATNPSARYATVEEIAALAVVLASDMGNYVVGDTLYASGGGGTVSLHR